MLGIGRVELVQDKFTAVDNDGQQIIEVVRDATGEPAHGFHFVSALDFALETLARFFRAIVFRTHIAYVQQYGRLTQILDPTRADGNGDRSAVGSQTESF